MTTRRHPASRSGSMTWTPSTHVPSSWATRSLTHCGTRTGASAGSCCASREARWSTWSHTGRPDAVGGARNMDLSLTRIEAAVTEIDPVFLDTPQFVSERLSEEFGREVLVKVESLNPIGSFK